MSNKIKFWQLTEKLLSCFALASFQRKHATETSPVSETFNESMARKLAWLDSKKRRPWLAFKASRSWFAFKKKGSLANARKDFFAILGFKLEKRKLSLCLSFLFSWGFLAFFLSFLSVWLILWQTTDRMGRSIEGYLRVLTINSWY